MSAAIILGLSWLITRAWTLRAQGKGDLEGLPGGRGFALACKRGAPPRPEAIFPASQGEKGGPCKVGNPQDGGSVGIRQGQGGLKRVA